MCKPIFSIALCNAVLIPIYADDAFGHMLEGEGASSLFGHQFSTHLRPIVITLVIFAIWLIGAAIYTIVLEPDFKKEQRKRRRKNSGGSACGSTDGCSGCGGD